MQNILLKIFVLLLFFLIIVSCCGSKEVTFPMGTFLKDSGINAIKVDNETYNNITSDDILKFTFNQKSSIFRIYNIKVINDPLYCQGYMKVWYGEDCNVSVYEKLNRWSTVYCFSSGISKYLPDLKGTALISPANFFNTKAGDFKVDKNNNKHWYVHYEGSWHKWDVSNVTKDIIYWKVYEEWEEYKKYYMDNETKGAY